MNKPKIHATCKAGCLWETVHKDDFDKSAAFIRQYPNDSGFFFLEKGKEYKIFAPKDTNNQFTCFLNFSYYDNGGYNNTFTFSIENSDKYAESFIFKLVATELAENNYDCYIVYEVAGVRYDTTATPQRLAYAPNDKEKIIVMGATSVLLINADATVTGEKGESGVTFHKNLIPTFTEDTTYTDYAYRGTIAIDGVTANSVVEVVFSLADAMSGNYAPIAETLDGVVYIYAKVNRSITIPSIIVFG